MSRPDPRARARLAGLLYLASGLPAGFSIFVYQRMMVRGDAAATAANILGSETLFRAGFVADLAGIVLFLAAVLVLHEVLRPAGRTTAVLMAGFGFLGATIQSLDCLGDITALLFLKGGKVMESFTVAQTQALAFQVLKWHVLLYDVAFVYFGVFCLLVGTLVLRSTFLPRVLGAFMLVDGLGYLFFGVTTFLAPPLSLRLYPVLPFATAALGEASLMLWLIVKAVDARRWEEQAAAA